MSDLNAPEKVAALVVALGPAAASEVMGFMSETEVEKLAEKVARIGVLEQSTLDDVMEEAKQQTEVRRGTAAGGIDYARSLLSQWQGAKGAEIMERLMSDLTVAPFSFVRDVDPDQLVHILKDELPQMVALIMAHQPPGHTAQVLAGFDRAMQAEVALRIGSMGRTSPEVISKVEDALRGRFGTVHSSEVTVRGGVADLAEVLNNSDRTTERGILEQLAQRDPALAEEVRALMFVFEDIEGLDAKTIQRVLQELETRDLALAMKGVGKGVTELITTNMSSRAAQALEEEIELLGAVRRSDVEKAQNVVVAVIRRLEEADEIVIARAGESDLIE